MAKREAVYCCGHPSDGWRCDACGRRGRDGGMHARRVARRLFGALRLDFGAGYAAGVNSGLGADGWGRGDGSRLASVELEAVEVRARAVHAARRIAAAQADRDASPVYGGQGGRRPLPWDGKAFRGWRLPEEYVRQAKRRGWV